jgi:hypothetical protein
VIGLEAEWDRHRNSTAGTINELGFLTSMASGLDLGPTHPSGWYEQWGVVSGWSEKEMKPTSQVHIVPKLRCHEATRANPIPHTCLHSAVLNSK